jgi:WD40 repeat protein
VDRELSYWLETKSPEKVLIVLTDGTLIWDASRGGFDPLMSDALSARLLSTFTEEPLYVDMRWARETTNLSLHDPRFLNQIADIAAPLHHKPKAELASTEVREHRRTVRVAWSAGMALLALTIAAAGLAVLAETQRRVANVKQHEAEITLARSDFVQGIQHIEGDEAGMAIPRLGRSLVLEPSRRSTATRLVSLLMQRWMPRVASEGPVLSGAIRFLIYSTSGRLLAAASGTELQVWDVATGKPLMPPFRHELGVTHIEFSPDEHWLVSSSGIGGGGVTPHGEVRLWDLHAPAAPVRKLDVDGMLWAAKFAPDGASIATASAFAVQFWRMADGNQLPQTVDFRDFTKQVPDFQLADNAFSDFAFTADGTELIVVAGAVKPGVVARWSLKDSEFKAIVPLPLVPRPIALDPASSSVLLSVPNDLLGFFSSSSAVQKGRALVLDRETLAPKSQAMVHDDLITDIEFLPHGLSIFSAAGDGGLKMWDAASGAPIAFNGRHRDRVSSIDVASHGLLVASGAKDGTARIWNALADDVHSEAMVHSSAVSAVRFDPTATHLATGTEAGRVAIWDLTPHRILPERLNAEAPAQAAELSADGTRLAVSSQDGIVRIWNVATGKVLGRFEAPKWANLHFANSAGALIIENNQRFRVVRLADGRAATDWIELGSEIAQISLDPKQERFLTATHAGRIDLWEVRTGKHIGGPLSHREAVNSAVFTTNGNIVSASGRALVLWDPTNGRQLATAENKAPRLIKSTGGEELLPNEVIDVRLTSDGKRILALYGWTGVRGDFVNIRRHFVLEQVGLWSSDLELIANLEGHDPDLNFVTASPDGKLVATSSRTGIVRVWSAETGRQSGEPLRHSFFVKQLDFTAGSDRLVVSGKPDWVAIWRGWTGDVRPITLRTDGPESRVIVGSPAGTLATLAGAGVLELWDEETGRRIADKLIVPDEAELLSADTSGETFAVTDKIGQSWVWRLPLPKTDAARCMLAKAGERAGGFGLSDSDVAVPLGSLQNPGRVFSQKCESDAIASPSAMEDWLSLPRDGRTIAPGISTTMHDYVRDILKAKPDSKLAIKLMLEDPSDPCLRSALATMLTNAGDRMSGIGKFLTRQSGLRSMLAACD